MLGGGYRMVLKGSGIALSVVGRGVVTLDGDPRFAGDDAGVYSLDGVDCSIEPQNCVALPSDPQRFTLGSAGGADAEASSAMTTPLDDPRGRGRDLDRVLRRRHTSVTPATR